MHLRQKRITIPGPKRKFILARALKPAGSRANFAKSNSTITSARASTEDPEPMYKGQHVPALWLRRDELPVQSLHGSGNLVQPISILYLVRHTTFSHNASVTSISALSAPNFDFAISKSKNRDSSYHRPVSWSVKYEKYIDDLLGSLHVQLLVIPTRPCGTQFPGSIPCSKPKLFI